MAEKPDLIIFDDMEDGCNKISPERMKEIIDKIESEFGPLINRHTPIEDWLGRAPTKDELREMVISDVKAKTPDWKCPDRAIERALKERGLDD